MTNNNKYGYFSIFKSFYEDKATYRVASFDKIKEIIAGKDPALQVEEITKRLRSESNEAEQLKLKKKLPFLTVSTLYNEVATDRKEFASIVDASGKEVETTTYQIQHSGYACLDFDHLTANELKALWNELKTYSFVHLLHISPREEGIKAYVCINNITLKNHKEVVAALFLYLFEKHRILADTKCLNLARGTFLPFEPNFYSNDNNCGHVEANELLDKYPNSEAKVKALFNLQTKKLLYTAPTNLSTWVVPTLNQVVSVAQKPKKQVIGATTSLLNHAQIFEKYKDYLIQKDGLPVAGNRHTFYLKLNNLKNEGLTCEEIVTHAIDYTTNNGLENQYTAEMVRADIERAYKDEAGYPIPSHIFYPDSGPKEKERINLKNVRETMQKYFDFYFDKESDQYYYTNAGDNNPFDFERISEQSRVLNDWLGLLEQENIFIKKDYLRTSLFSLTTCKAINYFAYQLEYLHKNYDKQDYITPLLSSIITDNDKLFSMNFTKWAVALVAQIISTEQFVRNDNALILVGPQNGGKTGFFERLLWNFDLYASKPSFDFNNQKDALLMNDKALILLDEMSSYTKGDVKQMKQFFSQSKITGDRKYQESRDYKRNASFAGCSNNQDILKDDTGDRRFLVFNLLSYDKELFNRIDKKQLWGQIVNMYKNGFDYKFTEDEVKETMSRNANSYSIHKPEDSFLENKLTVTRSENDFISNTELDNLVNEYVKEYNVKSFISASVIKTKLQTLGLNTQRIKKVNGKTVRGISGVRDSKLVVNSEYHDTGLSIDFFAEASQNEKESLSKLNKAFR
jgi:hypothetical protein